MIFTMNITSNHRLEGVKFESVKGGSLMEIRRCLVIHFTSGASAMSTVEYWRKPEARGTSAHVIIDRDGTIIQCRQFNYTCGHSGVSRWRDPNTGKLYVGLNNCSIGIELANAGEDESLARKFSKEFVQARHRNGGPLLVWEKFTELQMSACLAVAKALVERYQLDDITGHDCVAPERKNDPGPAFHMEWLRKQCGFTGLPAVHKKPEQ